MRPIRQNAELPFLYRSGGSSSDCRYPQCQQKTIAQTYAYVALRLVAMRRYSATSRPGQARLSEPEGSLHFSLAYTPRRTVGSVFGVFSSALVNSPPAVGITRQIACILEKVGQPFRLRTRFPAGPAG
jgi:hypothetical protein